MLDLFHFQTITKVSKVWQNYTTKLTEISLKRTFHLPFVEAQNTLAKLYKGFCVFSKKDNTLFDPNRTRIQMRAERARRRRATHIHHKCTEVASGVLCHKEHNWNTNYTFLLSKLLRLNLSVSELQFGESLKNCKLGNVTIGNNNEIDSTEGKKQNFIFCGKHSPFSLFPIHQHIFMLIIATEYINGIFSMIFQTIDRDILSTSKSESVTNTGFHSLHFIQSREASLHFQTIQVEKHSVVSFKLDQIMNCTAKMFDGPGVLSKELDLHRNGSYITSSFICFLFLSITNTASRKHKFHFSSVPNCKTKSIVLDTSQNISLVWPSHSNHTDITVNLFVIHTTQGLQVNLTIDMFQYTQKYESNIYCRQGGVAIFDHFHKESKEILSFCEDTYNSYHTKNTAFSTNGSLLVVLYEFRSYATFKLGANIQTSSCGSVSIDPSILFQFCNNFALCLYSETICQNYLHELTRSSNLTLAVGQFPYQVKFSIPVSQCLVLQLTSLKLSPFNQCQKHSDLPFAPLHLQSQSSQSNLLISTITGSFQKPPSHYRILDNKITIHEPVDCVYCKIWRNSQTSSDNLTKKRWNPREYFLDQKEENVNFVVHIISKNPNSCALCGLFSFYFGFKPWIRAWADLLLWNATQQEFKTKSIDEFVKSYGVVSAIIPNKEDIFHKYLSCDLKFGKTEIDNLPETPDYTLHIRGRGETEQVTISIQVALTITKLFLTDTSAQFKQYVMQGNTVRLLWSQAFNISENHKSKSISLPQGDDTSVTVNIKHNATITFQWVYGHSSTELSKLIEVRQTEVFSGINNTRGTEPQQIMISFYVLYSYYVHHTEIFHFSWNRAFALCKDIGATLPVIRSRGEQHAILQLAKHSPQFKPAEIIFIALSWQVCHPCSWKNTSISLILSLCCQILNSFSQEFLKMGVVSNLPYCLTWFWFSVVWFMKDASCSFQVVEFS